MSRAFRSVAWTIVALAAIAFSTVGSTVLDASTALAAPPSRASADASSCLQLPQSLDLRTASDAQLLAYGLPTRDVIFTDLSGWTRWLAARPHRDCAQPSPIGESHRPQAGPSTAALPATHPTGGAQSNIAGLPDPHWSGESAIAARGTYRIAEVSYEVPTIIGGDFSAVYAWTGVGGDSSATSPNVLVQAGIKASINLVGGASYWSWVEVWPQTAPQPLPVCRLNVGDVIDLYVTSNNGNDGFDYFRITNDNAGCFGACILPTTNRSIQDTCRIGGKGPSFNSDSASGECIMERDGSYDIVEWNPPGHIWRMHYCEMNNADIQTLYHNTYYITNSSGQTLVYPGTVNTYGTFDQYWVRPS